MLQTGDRMGNEIHDFPNQHSPCETMLARRVDVVDDQPSGGTSNPFLKIRSFPQVVDTAASLLVKL